MKSVLLVKTSPVVFLSPSVGIDPSGLTLMAAFTSICIPDTSPGRKQGAWWLAGHYPEWEGKIEGRGKLQARGIRGWGNFDQSWITCRAAFVTHYPFSLLSHFGFLLLPLFPKVCGRSVPSEI